MRYVIIGNSAAAVGCVEGIRQVDGLGEITIIAGENHHTYARPLISYWLSGKTTEEKLKYRPADFYVKNKVDILFGETAFSIDPDTKQVFLESGEYVLYDKLLVATGAKPFIPQIEGLETVAKRFAFMTIDDAKALRAALNRDSRVLILGAGLIGLKCAEGIADIAAGITVVDLAPRILPSILDEEGSAFVKAHLKNKGLRFILSDSIDRFEGNRAVLKKNKTRIPFDVLVVAVGVRPNTELIAGIDGEVNKGIVTDLYCRTSIEDIYAAGDCAESYDITSGENKVLALLPNAYMQGECAGINMAGKEKPYDKALPLNAVGFFGLPMCTAGSYIGEALVTKSENSYKKLVVKDNLLKGFILIGAVERAGIYTALIRNMTPLDTIDFELIREKPQLMAFSKKDRAVQLGGGRV